MYETVFFSYSFSLSLCIFVCIYTYTCIYLYIVREESSPFWWRFTLFLLLICLVWCFLCTFIYQIEARFMLRLRHILANCWLLKAKPRVLPKSFIFNSRPLCKLSELYLKLHRLCGCFSFKYTFKKCLN